MPRLLHLTEKSPCHLSDKDWILLENNVAGFPAHSFIHYNGWASWCHKNQSLYVSIIV